jgi:hypothetical protein
MRLRGGRYGNIPAPAHRLQRGDPTGRVGQIGRVWRELAGPVYPAMVGIGCTALWQPEAMPEILGKAVIPDERLRVLDSTKF